MKLNLNRLLGAILLAVLLYGAFVAYTGYRSIAESLAAFHWWAFAAALGLACLNYAIRFAKWQFYLEVSGVTGVKRLDSLLVFLSGFVLTVTPGKVGEVFKSAVLARTHGVPVARTAPIVIAERLTDLISIVILIVAGSAAFAGGLMWALAGSVAIGIGFVFIFWQAPATWLLARLRVTFLARFVPRVEQAYLALRGLLSPSKLAWPVVLSVFAWGAEGIALYLLLVGFEQSVSTPQALFFYSTATLAGALVPVPGGLGVTEPLMQEQLVRLGGVALPAATSSMLLIRFATLWWAVLVGFAALFVLRRRFSSLRAASTP
jgi:uncharacterized membrane protein YbhN (UPF0104 family)